MPSSNKYVELARSILAKSNILPPITQDCNLIVKASYGAINLDSGNNLVQSRLFELKFRVRQDKRPDIIFEDSNPELTRYVKGLSISPLILPDWVLPGQSMKGTLNNQNGVFIISNVFKNPHGINDIVGNKVTGRFVLTLT
jgi:hypothetical protein